MGSGLPKPIGIGSLDARIRSLEERLKLMDGARRLAAATISEGGLTIVEGGSIGVYGGGGVNVTDGGGINLSGGGGLEWADTQGRLRMEIRQFGQTDQVNMLHRDESGVTRVVMGDLFDPDNQPLGPGLAVIEADDYTMFTARPGLVAMRSSGPVEAIARGGNATVSASEQIRLYADESAYLRGYGGEVFIRAHDGHATLGASEQVRLYADTSAFLRAYGGSTTISATSSINLDAENNVNIIPDNNFTIRTESGSHRIHTAGQDVGIDAPNRLYVAANLYAEGTINSGGEKHFVIAHPTREGRALIHSSTESPVAGVEYTGTATLDSDGQAVVDLPHYFEALTAKDGRTVHLTPVGRPFMVGADPVEDGQFTAYGEAGRSVSWLVKARRVAGTAGFDPEPLIKDSPMAPPEEAPSEEAA